MTAELKRYRACEEKAIADNFLYYCSNGDALLMGSCEAGCTNNGWGNSDSCNPDWKAAVRCDPWGGGPGGHWAWAEGESGSPSESNS